MKIGDLAKGEKFLYDQVEYTVTDTTENDVIAEGVDGKIKYFEKTDDAEVAAMMLPAESIVKPKKKTAKKKPDIVKHPGGLALNLGTKVNEVDEINTGTIIKLLDCKIGDEVLIANEIFEVISEMDEYSHVWVESEKTGKKQVFKGNLSVVKL